MLQLRLWLWDTFEVFHHWFHKDEESDHEHEHDHIIDIKQYENRNNKISELAHHLNCVMEEHFNLQTIL